MDEIERELVRAINTASARGDNDKAHELATGLWQYRHYYKAVSDVPCALAAHRDDRS